jgi:hypothetical protein
MKAHPTFNYKRLRGSYRRSTRNPEHPPSMARMDGLHVAKLSLITHLQQSLRLSYHHMNIGHVLIYQSEWSGLWLQVNL